jgi:hypothetical protein
MYSDSGFGFLVLRNMLEGGAFNNFITPDPANIANDVAAFLIWWSPGQYLVPGSFVWLGTDYGLALALTALISTIVGLIGWAQVARSFSVSPFVLLVFVCGLATFRFTTLPFRIYNGGEVLLFGAAPWCLYWLRWAVDKPPAVCFAISLISAALLFIVKLTGLVVFALTVLAIVAIEVIRQRRLPPSILAMLAASGVGAVLFMIFWASRGALPASGAGITFTWQEIFFPISAAAFSGVSGNDLLAWLLIHPSKPILSDFGVTSYVLGPLGLLLLFWVWRRLRNTRYRPMAICLLTIIALSAAAIAAMYFRHANISYIEERNLRYAGILSFLLLLVALDQWRAWAGKALTLIGVGAFAVYGLASFANGERQVLKSHSYDPLSGTSQEIVSPAVLEYLRSQMTANRWQRAIAVIPSSEAAIALPRFRIITSSVDFTPLEVIAKQRWAGKVEKLFVIVQDRMVGNGKAEALLKSFVDYGFDKWRAVQIDGMIVYEQ